MYKDALLKLRSDVAKENHGATYLVFNDREMEELLLKRPATLEQLTKIKGFPKNGKRVECYGNRLVSIFSGQKTSKPRSTRLDIKESSCF